jgi:hypothetical protein
VSEVEVKIEDPLNNEVGELEIIMLDLKEESKEPLPQ